MGQCCEGVLWRSGVEKCCEGVLWGSVVEKCCKRVMWRSVVVMEKSLVEKCWRTLF